MCPLLLTGVPAARTVSTVVCFVAGWLWCLMMVQQWSILILEAALHLCYTLLSPLVLLLVAGRRAVFAIGIESLHLEIRQPCLSLSVAQFR